MNILTPQFKSFVSKTSIYGNKRITAKLFSPLTHQRRGFVGLANKNSMTMKRNLNFSKRYISRSEALPRSDLSFYNELKNISVEDLSRTNSLEEKLAEAIEKQQKKMAESAERSKYNKKQEAIREKVAKEYTDKIFKEIEEEDPNLPFGQKVQKIREKLAEKQEEIYKRLEEEDYLKDEPKKASAGENPTKPNETVGKETKETKNTNKTTANENKSTNNMDSPSTPPMNMKQQLIMDVILLALAGVMYYMSPNEESSIITWHQLVTDLLANGYIDHITVRDDSTVCVFLKKDIPEDSNYKPLGKNGEPHIYMLRTTSTESFERKFERAEIELGIPNSDFIDVTVRNSLFPKEALPSLLINLALMGLIFYLPYKAMKRLGNGGGLGGIDSILNVGKAKITEATKSNVTFADVAGVDEAKQEVMEFIDFLKNPDKYAKLGAKIPKGALFVGPPGTGKTLLAKATAGEANVPFLSMSGSDFVEMYVGVGASRVRDLFAEARKKSPCIIFIDEIDAVARKRSSGKFGGNDEREATLNQMLVEMDGFKERDGVVVFASTNRLDILDPALLRPGRFDRQISVDPPDIRGRKQIASIYIKKMNVEGDPEKFSEKVAELTPGLTGADIQNILNETCIAAARRNAEKVSYEDLYKGIDRVLGGIEKKNKVISKEEKRRIAIHEAGHALMGWFMTSTDPLLKVTIVPRGPAALGYAQYLPQDIHLYTRSELYEKLCVFMGGRAAEKLEYGEYSIGGADDLEKATKLSYGMVTNYGFGTKVGQINYGNENNGYVKPYSEATGQKIDEEVFALIDSAFADTTKMIQEHHKDLLAIADLLLAKETITYQDIEKLLGKRAGASPQNYQELVDNAWKPEEPKETPAQPETPSDSAPSESSPESSQTNPETPSSPSDESK